MKKINLYSALGVATREFPISTDEVDCTLFVDGKLLGVVEAKCEEIGQSIIEVKSSRYANSTFKWVKTDYSICDILFDIYIYIYILFIHTFHFL